MLKSSFLKKLGLIAATGVLALVKDSTTALAATDEPDPLTGLWEMTVVGKSGTYRYVYSISHGTWVATGNIDEGFLQYRYSPSMGAYTHEKNGLYRYSEKGWVFDRKGNNIGTFQSVGTFRFVPAENAFSGPGTFKQFDLRGKPVFVEAFAATATRVTV